MLPDLRSWGHKNDCYSSVFDVLRYYFVFSLMNCVVLISISHNHVAYEID